MSEEAVEIKNVDVTSYCVLTSYQSLLNSVYNAELAYLNAKKQYEKEEVRQWLTCDNDLEFQSKKRTVKEKEMWIKDKILHLKENRDAAKANLDDIKRIYEIALKYGLEALK